MLTGVVDDQMPPVPALVFGGRARCTCGATVPVEAGALLWHATKGDRCPHTGQRVELVVLRVHAPKCRTVYVWGPGFVRPFSRHFVLTSAATEQVARGSVPVSLAEAIRRVATTPVHIIVYQTPRGLASVPLAVRREIAAAGSDAAAARRRARKGAQS